MRFCSNVKRVDMVDSLKERTNMQAQRYPKIEPERLQECILGVFSSQKPTMRIVAKAKCMS
jgi:hypothetical protein